MSILHLYGYTHRHKLRLTLSIAIGVAAVVLVLMLWINPWISAKRQQLMESDEATVHLVQTMIPGRFQVSPDGHHVMYVEKLSRDRQRAQNVFLAQEKENKTPDESTQNAWMLVLADEGYQIKDKFSPDQLFVMTDGYRYEGIPGQNDYKIAQFKRYTLRIPQSDMRVSHQESETLNTTQLWADYANPKRAAELQWRFSIALSALLLAMLAVPLSTLRPRENRYAILLPAVLIYILYVNLLFVARHWVEQGSVSLQLGMWWVHGFLLFFILIAIYLQRRYASYS